MLYLNLWLDNKEKNIVKENRALKLIPNIENKIALSSFRWQLWDIIPINSDPAEEVELYWINGVRLFI